MTAKFKHPRMNSFIWTEVILNNWCELPMDKYEWSFVWLWFVCCQACFKDNKIYSRMWLIVPPVCKVHKWYPGTLYVNSNIFLVPRQTSTNTRKLSTALSQRLYQFCCTLQNVCLLFGVLLVFFIQGRFKNLVWLIDGYGRGEVEARKGEFLFKRKNVLLFPLLNPLRAIVQNLRFD